MDPLRDGAVRSLKFWTARPCALRPGPVTGIQRRPDPSLAGTHDAFSRCTRDVPPRVQLRSKEVRMVHWTMVGDVRPWMLVGLAGAAMGGWMPRISR